MNPNPLRPSLFLKIMFLLLVLFLLLVFSAALSFVLAKQSENDALSVNVAGQQRFLSERIARDLLDLSDLRTINKNTLIRLSHDVENFDSNLIYLEKQLTKTRMLGVRDSLHIRQLLSIERAIWATVHHDLKSILQNHANNYRHIANTYLTVQPQLFAISNKVTEAFQKAAETHIYYLAMFVLFTLMVALVFLISSALLIKNRIIRPLHQAIEISSRISLDGEYQTFLPQIRGNNEIYTILRNLLSIVNWLKLRARAISLISSSADLTESFHKLGQMLQADLGLEKMILTGAGADREVISSYPQGSLLNDFKAANPAELIIEPLICGTETVAFWHIKARDVESANMLASHMVKPIAMHLSKLVRNAMYYEEIKRAYFDNLKLLICAVDAKDGYTASHSINVSHYAYWIARELGLRDKELTMVHDAALLHDVGKIGIPDEILRKPGKLTEKERQQIEQHPVIGAEILQKSSLISDLAAIVRHHHERFDGLGYPDRLNGHQIPLPARILAVADTFDAMVSDRPYRRGLPVTEVLNYLRENSGTRFDPLVVEAFMRWFERLGGSVDEPLEVSESAMSEIWIG